MAVDCSSRCELRERERKMGNTNRGKEEKERGKDDKMCCEPRESRSMRVKL